MALIVEDGSVVAGAESYCSVTDANTYHTARGNVAWAALATDELREQALRRATDYMTQVYRSRWKGYRKSALQVLDWPRSFLYLEPFVIGGVGEYPYLVSDLIVPQEVKNVCAELALRASSAPLNPDLGRSKLSVTVGPISTTYDPNSPEKSRYSSLDATLAPYLSGTSISARLVRT